MNENEKTAYIEKLGTAVDSIGKILANDKISAILGFTDREELRKQHEEAKRLKRKLENDEWEVAIVGLEKAGKSSFANALMQRNILPTKDGRCTYTATRIEYLKEGKQTTVYFYDSKTFNDKLREMLTKMELKNAEHYSFVKGEGIVSDSGRKMTLDEFNRLYRAAVENNPTIDAAYGDNIKKEIEDIVSNAGSISELLDRTELHPSDENDVRDYIVEPRKALAVKEVVIYSEKLDKLPNVVIFDVPGFDSPTNKHKEQTLEKMKDADVIIVVANAKSYSLNDASLKMLRNSDKDGTMLLDKLFVFANKVETCTDIRENEKKTIEEWTGRGFVVNPEKRIVFGSALAYLQNEELVPTTGVNALRDFNERKDEMPNGFGIKEILDRIDDYNKNERFTVLKRRCNDIVKKVDDIAAKLLNECGSEENDSFWTQDKMDAFNDFLLGNRKEIGAIDKVKEALNDLKGVIKEDMDMLGESKLPINERPLSKRILENLISTITKENYSVTDEEISNKKRDLNKSTGGNVTVSKIEERIREDKFYKMYGDFSNNIVGITDKRHFEYGNKVIATILEALGVYSGSADYKELYEKLKQELIPYRPELDESLSGCNDKTASYYSSLIERFARDVYEILIAYPYTAERYDKKFFPSMDNFLSMAVFYKPNGNADDKSYASKTLQELPFCKKLLFHDEAEKGMAELFKKVCTVTKITELGDEAKELVKKFYAIEGNKAEAVINYIENAFKSVASGLSNAGRLNVLITNLKNKVGTAPSLRMPSIAEKEDFSKYCKNYFATSIKYDDYDDFRREFDKDIEILRDVMVNAFVYAINLEKPFATREEKSIEDIIKQYVDGKFTKFISHNFDKIVNEDWVEKQKEIEARRKLREELFTIKDSLNK